MLCKKNCSGIILAGGRSNRFGHLKYFLDINGDRLIDRVIKALKTVFKEIIIVTNKADIFSEYKDINIVEDIFPGRGPLGGLYTGLKHIKTDYGFTAASDMPLLNTGLIEKLLKSFNPDKHDCLIPINSGRKEVLHAFYSKSITPLIEEKLEQNNLKIRSIFPSLRCRYVRLNREEKKYLLNINTKEDLARLY